MSLLSITPHPGPATATRPLFFFPGLDGTPLPSHHLSALHAQNFAPTSIAHAAPATPTWDALARAAASVVESAGPGAVVVGESFGAALAIRVAALLCGSGAIDRLVLINSGTALAGSGGLSSATRLLPLLRADASGRLFYPAAAEILYRGFLVDGKRVRGGNGRIDVEAVPLETMLHRVQMLREFRESFGDDCLATLVTVPTTLVASRKDRLLGSVKEAQRLARILPNIYVSVVLEDSAHACLLEDGVSMADLVGAEVGTDLNSASLSSPASAKRALSSPDTRDESNALSYEDARDLGRKLLRPLRALTSPIFLGRENVEAALRIGDEAGRPVLFVGPHGVYGLLDTPLLVEELGNLVGSNRRLRSLAHESHFSQFSDMTSGRWGNFFSSLGAVPATARNFYKLLRSGEPVLLFPGGPVEVCRRRGEKNVLRWRDETDFIRPAAKLDAVIVPFSSWGADEAIDILVDGQEMQDLPLVGHALTRLLEKNNFDPEYVMPVGFPSRRVQFKFEFHEPIETVDVAANDKDACGSLYHEICDIVQAGMTRLGSLSDVTSEGTEELAPPTGLRAQLISLLDDLLPL